MAGASAAITSSFSGDGASRAWFSEPCMLGIDEAGRGPVLGPMVYGCAFCAISDADRVAKQAYADSKTLTEEKRDQLFDALKDDGGMGWAVDVISPQVLSAHMLRREKVSLNAISHDSAMGLIRLAIDNGVNVQQVYVDTVGDPASYQERLSRAFPRISFTVAARADSKYPIVSAASIAAKVTRDAMLRDWKFVESGSFQREFGCGYPGDEVTKSWLMASLDPLFGFPSIVRFSWATCRRLLEENCVDVAWDGEEEEEVKGETPIAPKIKKRKRLETESVAASRFGFFKSRHLQPVTTKF